MRVTRITLEDRSKASKQNAYPKNQHNLSWGGVNDNRTVVTSSNVVQGGFLYLMSEVTNSSYL